VRLASKIPQKPLRRISPKFAILISSRSRQECLGAAPNGSPEVNYYGCRNPRLSHFLSGCIPKPQFQAGATIRGPQRVICTRLGGEYQGAQTLACGQRGHSHSENAVNPCRTVICRDTPSPSLRKQGTSLENPGGRGVPRFAVPGRGIASHFHPCIKERCRDGGNCGPSPCRARSATSPR
jgi:hypothetical protein